MEEEKISNNSSETKRTFTESELWQMINSFVKLVFTNKYFVRMATVIAKSVAVISSVILFFAFFLYITPFITDPGCKNCEPRNVNTAYSATGKEYKKQILALQSEVKRLTGKYQSLTPGQSYLVINTTSNRFYLYRNRKLIREGFCSSGSYTRLVTPEGSRQWVFKTPKGRFWIQQKIVKPLWVKPDWAFIEEGLTVPPPDSETRYEWGVLGDYAMSLGDGYLIHGTLYKRLLGMPVTHGCVRLNDEDIEALFNNLFIGSKVYIF